MTHTNKKGITRDSLVLLLLVLAFVAAFMWFSTETAHALAKQSDVQLCRTSAIQGSWSFEHKIAFVKVIDIDSPIRLNCKTQYVDLKDDKILFGDHTKKLSGNDNDNTIILKELVLDQLSECWFQFGAGKTGVQEATDAKSACIICSELTPDKKFVDNFGHLIVDDIYSYARSHEGRLYGANTKYMSYLTADSELPDPSEIDEGRTIQFDDVSKSYFTVFQVVDDQVAGADIDSGVVDCAVAGKSGDDLKKYNVRTIVSASVGAIVTEDRNGYQRIGCDENGNIDGVNFGTVLDGGTVTVRMVPASGITAENCQRLI